MESANINHSESDGCANPPETTEEMSRELIMPKGDSYLSLGLLLSIYSSFRHPLVLLAAHRERTAIDLPHEPIIENLDSAQTNFVD